MPETPPPKLTCLGLSLTLRSADGALIYAERAQNERIRIEKHWKYMGWKGVLNVALKEPLTVSGASAEEARDNLENALLENDAWTRHLQDWVRTDQRNLPTYHEMLDQLCSTFGIPGSPTFNEALTYLKLHLKPETSKYTLAPIEEPTPTGPIVEYTVRHEDLDASLGGPKEAAAGLEWLKERELEHCVLDILTLEGPSMTPSQIEASPLMKKDASPYEIRRAIWRLLAAEKLDLNLAEGRVSRVTQPTSE